MALPKKNTEAPAFALPDQDGKEHSLSDYSGKWLLLYFYPKDDTPGCTKEAEGIRDMFSRFKRMQTAVLGISPDSPKKHKKFVEKYDLPFTLLSDEGKRVLRKYGVWGKKKFMGREYEGVLRTSFLIDPHGKIKKIYESVVPDGHATEVLEDLKLLR